MRTSHTLLFLTLAGGLFLAAPSKAQDNDLSVKRVMDDAETQINQIEKNNYKISKLEIDLIHQSRAKKTYVKLVAGRPYEIRVIGERNRVGTMDMKIEDLNGNILKSIPNHTNVIDASFTPETTTYYQFELNATEFFSGYTAARYIMIVSFR